MHPFRVKFFSTRVQSMGLGCPGSRLRTLIAFERCCSHLAADIRVEVQKPRADKATPVISAATRMKLERQPLGHEVWFGGSGFRIC